MSRNRRNVIVRPSPVATTKSARRRFSRSGICARRMLANRLSVMPGRRMTRSRCTRAGADTTSTKSQRSGAPVSYSSGMSSTTSFSRRTRARATNRFSACRTIGCKIASSRRSAAGSPNTRWPSRRRSIPPLSSRTPGNSASTPGTAAPPGPSRRCTTASASNSGTPSRRSMPAAVLFPIPIEPVRPRTITAPQASSKPRRAARGSLVPGCRTRPRSRGAPGAAACRGRRPCGARAAAPRPAAVC